jgi:methionyl-tRNA formyltransferase
MLLAGYAGFPQDEAAATYGCTRTPADGEIDWTAPTDSIHRLVRALVAPFPGAFTYFSGVRLKIWRTEMIPDAPRYAGRVPGRVVAVSKKTGHADVLTGDGVLRLLQVQLDGQPPAPAGAVISSTSQTLGLRTSDLILRIEELERIIGALARSSPHPVDHKAGGR